MDKRVLLDSDLSVVACHHLGHLIFLDFLLAW